MTVTNKKGGSGMKKYRITWEYIQTGVSSLKADNLEEAMDKAPDSITDFGDPTQFEQVMQWNDGWKAKSVAEEK